MLSKRTTDLLFYGLCASFAVYAGLFIFGTSHVINGQRHFILFDDAMISMTYARTLADGHGLVWYPGAPRVEGFTNPLWVGYMALWHLTGISNALASLPIQLTALGLLLINLVLVRKIALLATDGNQQVALLAAGLTAFYLPINNWALQGMEVGLLIVMLNVSVLGALRANAGGVAVPLWVFALLGASTLVRIDMAAPAAVVGLWAALTRSAPPRRLLLGGGIILLCLLGQTLARYAYYGAPLPNTYYLKVTGFPAYLRWLRGLFVAGQFLLRLDVLWVIVVGLYLRRHTTPALMLLTGLIVGQLAYSVYVGGDAWEGWGGSNRYIVIAMPLFFVALAGALPWLIAALGRSRTLGRVKPPMLALVLVALLVIDVNKFQLGEWLLIEPPLHVEDNWQVAELAYLIKDSTTPEARVAVVWAGIIPYFSERPAIDLLGKSDTYVAHLAMRMATSRPATAAFYPGHLKYEYAYSIIQLKPDVIAQFWDADRLLMLSPPESIAGYVRTNYAEYDLPALEARIQVALRSQHINYDRLPAPSTP